MKAIHIFYSKQSLNYCLSEKKKIARRRDKDDNIHIIITQAISIPELRI